MSGGGGSTTVNTPAPKSAAELEIEKVNLELAKKQLANVEALQPFQQELINLSLADLRRSGAINSAVDAAITPEQQAAFQKQEFERAQRLGPVQDELMQLQLDSLRRGGAATPEQLALIKQAADAGIEAGSADIDLSTKRGIGLISDELANSRGLRLTDSPIMNEAGLLARSGEDQKANLIKSMRAGQATAALNHPLAVQQLQSGINLNTQSVASNAQQFQQELRQRAYQNRLALSGQTGQTGIGLSSIQGPRLNQPGQTGVSQTEGAGPNWGAIASGVGMAMFAASDRRLKDDYGVVGKTAGGIDLHVYRYKGEDATDPLRLGVMADDVEKVNPRAVFKHSSGYKVVDYSQVR